MDLRAISAHLDRQNRLTIPLSREGLVTREAGGAWITRDVAAESEFASNNLNRLHWLACDTPVRIGQIREAVEVMQGLGAKRFFAWMGPLAWDAQSHADLQACGGTPVPYVRYVVLARDSADYNIAKTQLIARPVERHEFEQVLAAIEPWYKARGVAALRRLLAHDSFELHAAFDGAAPVAIAAFVGRAVSACLVDQALDLSRERLRFGACWGQRADGFVAHDVIAGLAGLPSR